jgi:nucleotide-binding universal stress UspA family protein
MTVLVAYNLSPHGEAAVRTGLAEASRRRLPLAVLDLHPEHADAPVPDGLAALLDAAPRDVEVGPVAVRSGDRDPADAIIDTAESVGATLVIIGARKRSGLGTIFMGSTTQRVLLDSPVPVLVVKDVYDG